MASDLHTRFRKKDWSVFCTAIVFILGLADHYL
jgi:hypothetical protein